MNKKSEEEFSYESEEFSEFTSEWQSSKQSAPNLNFMKKSHSQTSLITLDQELKLRQYKPIDPKAATLDNRTSIDQPSRGRTVSEIQVDRQNTGQLDKTKTQTKLVSDNIDVGSAGDKIVSSKSSLKKPYAPPFKPNTNQNSALTSSLGLYTSSKFVTSTNNDLPSRQQNQHSSLIHNANRDSPDFVPSELVIPSHEAATVPQSPSIQIKTPAVQSEVPAEKEEEFVSSEEEIQPQNLGSSELRTAEAEQKRQAIRETTLKKTKTALAESDLNDSENSFKSSEFKSSERELLNQNPGSRPPKQPSLKSSKISSDKPRKQKLQGNEDLKPQGQNAPLGIMNRGHKPIMLDEMSSGQDTQIRGGLRKNVDKSALARKNTHFAADVEIKEVARYSNTMVDDNLTQTKKYHGSEHLMKELNKVSAISGSEKTDARAYKNPKERARRALSIRHGVKDPRDRQPRDPDGMVVKGPAGGYTNAYIKPSQSPSEFFKKQGTVRKLHKISDRDSESLRTDSSFEKTHNRQNTQSQMSIDYTGDPGQFNRQRSKRILNKKVDFDKKKLQHKETIKRVLTLRSVMSKKSHQDKTAKELVKEFVSFQPGPEFDQIKGKLTATMTKPELEVEHLFLTQKLSHVSNFLTRLVEKTYIKEEVQDGKARGMRKGLTAPMEEVQEQLLTDQMHKNARKKERQLRREYQELEIYFRRLMDPDLVDKVKAEMEYLDEMIKGESLSIQKLNNQITKFRKLDFVARDVHKEKMMVAIEEELMRLKSKISDLQDSQIQWQDNELKIDEQLIAKQNLFNDLKAQLQTLKSPDYFAQVVQEHDLEGKQKLTAQCERLQKEIDTQYKVCQASVTVQQQRKQRFAQKCEANHQLTIQESNKLHRLDYHTELQKRYIADLQQAITEERRRDTRIMNARPVKPIQLLMPKSQSSMALVPQERPRLILTQKKPKPQRLISAPDVNQLFQSITPYLSAKDLFTVPEEPLDYELRSPHPPPRLSKDEVRELQRLRRRYGWQPSGFTQKKVYEKSHDLVDDAESSPRLARQIQAEFKAAQTEKPINQVFFNRRSASQGRPEQLQFVRDCHGELGEMD